MNKPILSLCLTLILGAALSGPVVAHDSVAVGPAAERLMTPRERVERNLSKEVLRGRWDRDARIPSEAAVEYSRERVREVLRRIQTDPNTADLIARIRVSSKGRTVTLSGWVQKPEDALAFAQSVRSMDGVDEVVDLLKVASSAEELLG